MAKPRRRGRTIVTVMTIIVIASLWRTVSVEQESRQVSKAYEEAQARVERMEHQQVLLREGLALQVKAIFLQLLGTQNQEKAAASALQAAEDNRQLNARAYKDELVEVQDVIEAQLLESFMRAQYQKLRYDHAEVRAQLEFVIGREVASLVQG